jgi:hypothetical protein
MHEGARNRACRLPLMLSRGRDCNRSVFTDSCCTRYFGLANEPLTGCPRLNFGALRINVQKLLDLGRR